MDEPWLGFQVGELLAPEVEAVEEVGRDGAAGLDLDGVEGVGSGMDEGVDFLALLVAKGWAVRWEALGAERWARVVLQD